MSEERSQLLQGHAAGPAPDANGPDPSDPTDDDDVPVRPRQVTLVGGITAESTDAPPSERSTLIGPAPDPNLPIAEVTASPRQVTNAGIGGRASRLPNERVIPGRRHQDAAAMKVSHAKTLPAAVLPGASASGTSPADDDTSPISAAPTSSEAPASRVPEAAAAPTFGATQSAPHSVPPPPPPFVPPEPPAARVSAAAPVVHAELANGTTLASPPAAPADDARELAPELAATAVAPDAVPRDPDAHGDPALRNLNGAKVNKWKWGGLLLMAGGATAGILFFGGSSGSSPTRGGPQALSPSPTSSARASAPVKERRPPRTTPPTAPAVQAAPEVAASEESVEALIRLEGSQATKACKPPLASKRGDAAVAAAALKVGRKALSQGKPEDALVAFCEATHQNPKNANAAISLVQTYLLLGDPAQAKIAAESAVERYPKNRKLQELFGDTLARSGDAERAVSVWLEFMNLDRGDAGRIQRVATKYVNLAARALKGADKAQAERLYRRAALLDPALPAAPLGLARVFALRQETKAALGWARRAVKLAPDSADARLVLGDALTKAGDLELAKRTYEEALQLDPRDDRVRARLGLDH